MNPQERFVSYLEEHPGYYLVSKSELYLNLLALMENEGKEFQELSGFFPAVEKEDLSLMLDSLISLKLVGALKTNDRIIYYLTKNAKDFLELYHKTKTGFGVK